ncbi:ACT domain-containing protein [Candidatus Omnitrophota bacterium]
MADCSKANELIITTEDKPGMLAEVTSVISSQGVNITAICAYGAEGKATFYALTSDNSKAKSAAKAKGWETKENEVVVVGLVDKVGALKEIADKLKAKGVNLKYCYGTTCSCAPNCACKLVFASDNSDAVIAALK